MALQFFRVCACRAVLYVVCVLAGNCVVILQRLSWNSDQETHEVCLRWAYRGRKEAFCYGVRETGGSNSGIYPSYPNSTYSKRFKDIPNPSPLESPFLPDPIILVPFEESLGGELRVSRRRCRAGAMPRQLHGWLSKLWSLFGSLI